MLQRVARVRRHFTGLEDETPHDLLLQRDKIEAEVACDVVTAEEGRGVHRGAWFRLADRIDPDLQTWLAAHPGRYLLKMTLPRDCAAACTIGSRQRNARRSAPAHPRDAGDEVAAGL